MREGDLVKFVGHANFYKGRIGVVCKLYKINRTNEAGKPDSALVYFAGAEKQGRAKPLSSAGTSLRHHKSGLHPMAIDELELVPR